MVYYNWLPFLLLIYSEMVLFVLTGLDIFNLDNFKKEKIY